MIRISQQAAQRILQIQKEENAEGKAIRISVRRGGCAGLEYELSFAAEKAPEELVFHDQGITILVPKKSLLFLAGTELDFSDGLEGKGFHFRNPNAARTCACGTSFSL
ncbi:MAG: HesB/IscA family protein [Bacteroidia bacterium]